MTDLVLRGGTVVNTDGMTRVDVVIRDGVVAEVTADAVMTEAASELDCRGKYILPGLVDAHSHVDALIFDDAVQRSLLAQGITTVITGQDGVSFAPGNGEYATEYFSAINGPHPNYSGGGIGGILATYDRATRLNVAYTVPAGTVRWEVCGGKIGHASRSEVERMQQMVADGLDEGAVGLSSGLDYVPGIFAPAAELAALCQPVADAGAVYATHMRGGYEANSSVGIDEIRKICADRALSTHISHFHAEPHIVREQLDLLEDEGIDTTFDLYPYTRGCTLLSMPLLPPELSAEPVDRILSVLEDPAGRSRLEREWFPEVKRKASLGPDWPDMITLAYIDAPDLQWSEGLTISEVAASMGRDPITAALDILRRTRLRANAVMAVRYRRGDTELGQIMSDHRHLGGSDGIFLGGHPHPRARGSFARYLRSFVVENETWTWPEAVRHLSYGAAQRFGLGRRGRIAPGWEADLAVIDPDEISDRATYESPLDDAVGVTAVIVGGQVVLAYGKLEFNTPGMGLRRSAGSLVEDTR